VRCFAKGCESRRSVCSTRGAFCSDVAHLIASNTRDPVSIIGDIQAQAAKDAFMAFLYYSPYRYAFSNKVHGFLVYPTGNFHMEDAWLSPLAGV